MKAKIKYVPSGYNMLKNIRMQRLGVLDQVHRRYSSLTHVLDSHFEMTSALCRLQTTEKWGEGRTREQETDTQQQRQRVRETESETERIAFRKA